MEKVHKLKTWPQHYQDVLLRNKKVEVRKNDRDFEEGDILRLQEFDPQIEQYTGNECEVLVTHILHGGQFGIEEGYCVMSLFDTIKVFETK